MNYNEIRQYMIKILSNYYDSKTVDYLMNSRNRQFFFLDDDKQYFTPLIISKSVDNDIKIRYNLIANGGKEKRKYLTDEDIKKIKLGNNK